MVLILFSYLFSSQNCTIFNCCFGKKKRTSFLFSWCLFCFNIDSEDVRPGKPAPFLTEISHSKYLLEMYMWKHSYLWIFFNNECCLYLSNKSCELVTLYGDTVRNTICDCVQQAYYVLLAVQTSVSLKQLLEFIQISTVCLEPRELLSLFYISFHIIYWFYYMNNVFIPIWPFCLMLTKSA